MGLTPPVHHDAPAARPLPAWLPGVLVGFTSAAVLVVEIVVVRLVAPYVGLTLESYTAAIAVALLGIAVGAALGGRLADLRDPREWLGAAIVVGGLLVLAVRPVVHATGPSVAAGGKGPAASVLLVALSTLAPVVVLSMVSPGVVKLRLRTLAETGTVVGRLSAIGTIGALAGSVSTGFFLLARLSTTQVLGTLGVALVVMGLVTGTARWWVTAPATLLAGALMGGMLVAVDGPCSHETAYYCARVEADPDRPGGRVLLLDDLRHAYVDLDDPDYLEFAYTQWFGAVLDVMSPASGAVEALHVGGGGFTMPQWVSATRPGSVSRVLELDPDVVRIARRELGLQVDAQLSVVTGDARRSIVAEPAAAYDVVVGDAFGSLSVPWHLATEEFVGEVRRVVRPGGTYVANVIDRGPLEFLRAELATVGAVFPHVALVAGKGSLEGRGGNFVVIASDQPLPLDELARALGAAPRPADLHAEQALLEFVEGARVLTDDWAPVDQLLTTSVALGAGAPG